MEASLFSLFASALFSSVTSMGWLVRVCSTVVMGTLGRIPFKLS